jgi:predicted RND superfamily exporter protein
LEQIPPPFEDPEVEAVVGGQIIEPELQEFQSRLFPALRQLFKASAKAQKLELKDVPPEILGRFVSDDQTYAIYAYPSVNIWEREPLTQFVNDLRSVDPEVTGPPIMFFEILNLVRNSYFQAGMFSALAIFLIFLIDFKSLRYTLLAFLPLILGTFSLFGLMSLFDLSFNTANMIALPMILGIGADNGVHMIHRFREEKESSIQFLFGSTGKALLITYLDTLTSFVSLAFANHQGLAQLGRVVILGITCCTAAGILFLPSIMVLIIKRRVKRKS